MSTDELDELFGRMRGQGPPAPFAPAAAVRRRGRQRTRRQAATAGLAVLAVLVLGAGSVATVVTGGDPDPVPPAATPTGAPAEIPPQWLLTADDLAAASSDTGWAETGNELLEGGWHWGDPCDGDFRVEDYSSLAQRRDVATAGWVVPGVRVDQIVELFDSADGAAANLADVEDFLARCGRSPEPGDEVAPTDYVVVGTDLAGDESLLVEVRAYAFDGDFISSDPVRWYAAVLRVGPAVTTLVSERESLLWAVAPAAAARLGAVPAGSPPAAVEVEPDPPRALPAACEVELLPEHPSWADSTVGARSLVTAADPTGRIIAGRGYPASGFPSYELPLVIWRDGEPEFLESPGSGPALRGINEAGVAVGYTYGVPPLPWIYQDGELTQLPGVESGQAYGINAHGDVAGVRLTIEDEVDVWVDSQQPVWWPAGADAPVDLPVPAGADGEAQGIDDDGTIVGFVSDAAGERAYVWRPDGSWRALPLPDGVGPGSRAYHIRNGWVAGTAGPPDQGMLVVRWHLPTGTVTTFPQFAGAPYAVNGSGWLMGSNADNNALLVTDDGDLVLPGLADGWDAGTTVSDDGRILAGQSDDADGNIRAVRWLCD